MIGRTTARQPDLTKLRPYGDTLDDGKIQLSFALPVPAGPEAHEAARQILLDMGLQDPQIVAMEAVGPEMAYFVCYAAYAGAVDYANLHVPKVETPVLDMEAIDQLILHRLGRKVVIVGACTGTDAHTVGIDAIMNMKGFKGHYGLERYQMVRALNLGAQVPNEALIARAIAEQADAIIVSQVVTQKNLHVMNLTNLVELLEAEGVRHRMVAVIGGPRITHDLATELGFDAGFGPGSYAEDVASFVVHELIRRLEQEGAAS